MRSCEALLGTVPNMVLHTPAIKASPKPARLVVLLFNISPSLWDKSPISSHRFLPVLAIVSILGKPRS